MTGKNSSDAWRFWKKGSATEGICEASAEAADVADVVPPGPYA